MKNAKVSFFLARFATFALKKKDKTWVHHGL